MVGIAPPWAAAEPAAPNAAAAAEAMVRAAAGHGAPAAARVEVLPGQLDPRLRLAPCDRIEPFLPPGGRPWGRTRVGLRCTQGAQPWSVYLPVTVKVLAPATVASAALPAGTTLRADQLQLAEVDWAAATSPVVALPEAVVGRTLARALAAGEPVRQADLQLRRWFSAGDTVRLLAEGPGFSASSEGQALGDGIEGRPVRVRTDGGRVIGGRAIGDRRVEVAP